MLYAIAENHSSSAVVSDDFIKVTASGTISVLSTLPFMVSNEFYSAVFNPCDNRYILSTGAFASSGGVYQFNTAGAIVQSDTTTGLYQGIDVYY
jgi:hypothetical protein